MSNTTGMCDSAKVELMSATHCFLATNANVSCSGSSSSYNLTGLASTAELAVGMGVSGTNIPSGCVIVDVVSASEVTVYPEPTGTVSSVTFTGDTFKILLLTGTPSQAYGPTQTNVGTPSSGTPSTSNVGTDEASGTGYTSGGFTLTNVNPSLPGNPTTTATTSFSVNPSWTSATFTSNGGIIYNSSTRLGAAATPLSGRTISVHDFGGVQEVTAGTFTMLMPTNDGSNAILRIA